MEYKVRKNPRFAACGLNCGLCPRYYTAGESRCPGCAGVGFSEVHPPCGILSCCERRGIEYCFLCEAFPCGKYKDIDSSDSFITHRNQISDFEKAKRIGLEAYEAEQDEKVTILETLLVEYNDGRRKNFFCLAVNLLELPDVVCVMERVAAQVKESDTVKERAVIAARLFQEMADERGILLKLRK